MLADLFFSRTLIAASEDGLTLWRRFNAEWGRNAPQVVVAKWRRGNDSPRCATTLKLWETLPLWEQLDDDIALGGLAIPYLLNAQALEKLVLILFCK